MTACKDVQDVNLGKKAVSAALAGTLAVGMVPAVALAAPADDAAADDGIESLALSSSADVAAGKITAATLNGAVISDLAKITVKTSDFDEVTNGSSTYELKNFEINQITTESGVVIDLTDANYDIEYWDATANSNAGGYVSALPAKPGAGSQKIQITLSGLSGDMSKYDNATLEVELKVVSASLAGTVAYVAGDEGNSDFIYNFGNAINPDFYLNGLDITNKVSPNYYDADSNTASFAAAGNYSIVLEGKAGTDYAGSKVTIPATIQKLDLSKANITLSGTKGGSIAVASVNTNTTTADFVKALKVVAVGPNGTVNNGAVGSYKVTVSPANANDQNIVGSQVIDFDITTGTAAFLYGGKDVTTLTSGQWGTDKGTPVYTYTAGVKGQAQFNYELLTAATAATAGTAIEDVTYTVTDGEGNAATVADLAKPGTWKVTAKVDANKTDYDWGGSQTVIVKNYAGAVNSSDIIVKQNGVVTATPSMNYTGEDLLGQIGVTVKSGDKTLTAGTDYQYEIKNADKEVVTEIVNQGNYTLTVTSDLYNVDSTGAPAANEVTITVGSASVTAVKPVGLVQNTVTSGTTTTTTEVFPYTGEVIKPTYEYTTSTAAEVAAGTAVWKELPADQYTVAYALTTGAAPLQAKGEYNVTFTPVAIGSSTNPSTNFDFSKMSPLKVTVADVTLRFQDVPTSSIFYNVINTAAENGYMTGYNGTKLFGPNDEITRAQVACVLFKMAGAPSNGAQDSYNEVSGYDTGFSDVDGHKWYAQAIAWAKNAKVISGYGDGTFGPNDLITRQQFATMLANYARAMGQSTTVEDVDAVLATKKDGGQVASWAKDSVAWAVSKQIMGNGGSINPKSDITRAEVAAMAVNFQPEKL